MSWRLKLRALRNRHLQRDLDDELASHIEMAAETLEAGGWPPDAALREARRRFGSVNQITETTRELHVFTFFETLLQDVRYGLRRLRREPGFTLVAILTLGLVIGANGAMFSLMEAVLLRPLPFAKPDQLVSIWGRTSQSPQEPLSPLDVEDYAKARSLSAVTPTAGQSVNLTGVDEPARLFGGFVSSAFFRMLDTQAALGRVFAPAEDAPDAPRVCVLSHGAWQDRFGGDAAILGRAVVLNGEPFTVIGVMSPSFRPAFFVSEVWMPIQFYPNYARNRVTLTVRALGRLADGVTLAQAGAELSTIGGQLASQYPDTNRGRGVALVPLREQMVGGGTRQTVLVLVGAVVCVLLVGCANVAGLLLTKAVGRKQEMALRASLGAGRGRLIRQLLTESLLLALGGGALGLALAAGGMSLMNAFWADLLGQTVLTLNATVVGYLLAVSTGTGLLFGLAPAFLARRQAAANSLRQRGTAAVEGHLRGVLVAAQVALALVLLIGAGLMMKSVARLAGVDPGFAGDRVLTLEYRVPRNKYPTGEQQAQFHHAVLDRVTALPGVQSAGLTRVMPFSGNSGTVDVTLPDRPDPPREAPFTVAHSQATPGYFQTLGIPIEGRDFSQGDTARSAPVIIVSRAFVSRFWPGERAIGRQVRLPPRPDGASPVATIVGVVGDTKTALYEAAAPQMYVPYAQQPFIFAALAVRTAGDPLAMTASVRRAIWAVDKDQPMWKIRTLQSMVEQSVSARRYTVFLLGGFSALALLLAALGLYGVLAYAVSQRTAEFGVRMAIGATPAEIVRLVIGRGVTLTLVGLGCGLAASLVLTRYLRTQMYDVSTYDPLVYASLSLLLLTVALLAVLLPARRAMRVDPVIALRHQ